MEQPKRKTPIQVTKAWQCCIDGCSFRLLQNGWRDKFDSFFLDTKARRMINTITLKEKSYDGNINNSRIRRLSQIRRLWKLRQRDSVCNGFMPQLWSGTTICL